MWRLMDMFGRPLAQLRRRKLQTLVAARQLDGIRPRPHRMQSTGAEEEPPRTLRWGIAPVNLMAEDFATALSVLPAHRHSITSCMDAYRSQALSFSNKHRVRRVYTSFEDLARCPDVDAVYISPLNAMHCELCHLMLNHDKHVLCEQPLGMTEQQVVELVGKARARGLFLMEGIWPRCIPAYHILRHEIMRCKLGRIFAVDCTLGWPLPIASPKAASYAGVAKDLAPYGIQLALWVYREVPQRLKVSGKLNREGIDVAANIELIFEGNRRARLVLSAEQELQNTATIRGTKGSATLNSLWCPTELTFENRDFEFELPVAERSTHFNNRIALCYEAEEMRSCILDGLTESNLFNHNESRLMVHLTSQIKEMLKTDDQDAAVQQQQAVN
ncbi:trans-1,2-dihydrobenzene-1,2-diol dehydrogenase [Drosophila montana]|uniref:trans-1,2-dihydrobenzene-1,2-diol dehydrogenase n=1 Tax=Drosophila montana TaxID=40370 RepID=UPI00313BF104